MSGKNNVFFLFRTLFEFEVCIQICNFRKVVRFAQFFTAYIRHGFGPSFLLKLSLAIFSEAIVKIQVLTELSP